MKTQRSTTRTPLQQADTGGHFVFDINGENAGFVKKFSGFAMEADIVSSDLGPDNVQKKHVASIKWTSGKATIGLGMSNECYHWIKAAFDNVELYVEKMVFKIDEFDSLK